MVTSTTRTISDSHGQPIALGAELGRGGEGIVYDLPERPDAVAKLYHEPPSAAKAAKLAAMATLGSERLLRLTAWPLGTLHREAGGPVVGLLMPRIDGHKAIHTLYSPKSRLTAFPQAGYPFLVHAAANAARAFAVIHDHGHVIGDVNHGNLVVSPQATAKLIDCDSFQIATAERLYRCEVGVATHTPPELQGKSFREVTRTANHDAFGLAVIVFQLLFMGRHPFSGAYSGPGEMPLEKSISEFRFAYSQHATTYQMRPPPVAPTLTTVTPAVATLFERAFAADGASGKRPAPQEWVDPLTALGQALTHCGKSQMHQYVSGLSECPWCQIEDKAGVPFFGMIGTSLKQAQAAFDLPAVWARIVAVARPGERALPNHSVAPSERAKGIVHARELRTKFFFPVATVILVLVLAITQSVGAVVVGALVFGLVYFLDWRHARLTHTAFQALAEAAQSRYDDCRKRWDEQATSAVFDQAVRALEAKRTYYQYLPDTRQAQLDDLGSRMRERQLQAFLDTFTIARASIDDIGPARVATLQSYGVETAADIEPRAIRAIPGFGPAYTDRLLAWRGTVESRFQFDAARGLDRADIDALDRRIDDERIALERALLAGPAELMQRKEQILAARESLWPELDRLAQQLAQARADSSELAV